MSLLNLNTSAGRGPRGKKSLKMFMGAGLLVAVLGIGSTLAANITLNSPIGETEFGQGITQTVYCGGDAVVTVTPTSGYSNSVKEVTLKTVTPTSSSSTEVPDALKSYKQTVFLNSSSRYPRFKTNTSTISGWWVSTATGDVQSSIVGYPTSFSAGIASGWFFVQETSSSNYYKKGTGAASSQPLVLTSDDQSNFKFNGLVISNIPPACAGVNFVFSAYDNVEAEAKSLTSSGTKVVAAKWTAGSGSVTPSTERKCLSSSAAGITATQKSTSLSFDIPATLTASSLAKVVVETQEDALTGNPC